jgi:hypothetical protein
VPGVFKASLFGGITSNYRWRLSTKFLSVIKSSRSKKFAEKATLRGMKGLYLETGKEQRGQVFILDTNSPTRLKGPDHLQQVGKANL